MSRRVLFVVPRFHTNLAGAVRALDGSGYAVSVFATSSRSDEDHSLIVPWTFGADPTERDVRQAVDQVAPDLILLRRAGALSDQVAKRAHKRRIPILAYDLTPLDRRIAPLKRLRRALAGKPLDRVTPVPGGGGRPDPRARLLPWPVFGDKAPAPLPRDNGCVSILCVGKLVQPRKNQDKLLAALDALEDAPPWRLTLAGSDTHEASGASDAHLRALQRRAEASGPGRTVTIRSNIPFREMPTLYRGHDICVLPAHDEPLGMAPLEAMAFGCIPVVAQDAGAAGYIAHGESGLLVDMTAPDDLRTTLSRLLAADFPRAAMSAAAHRAAGAQFGPQAFLMRFDALFDPWQLNF